MQYLIIIGEYFALAKPLVASKLQVTLQGLGATYMLCYLLGRLTSKLPRLATDKCSAHNMAEMLACFVSNAIRIRTLPGNAEES